LLFVGVQVKQDVAVLASVRAVLVGVDFNKVFASVPDLFLPLSGVDDRTLQGNVMVADSLQELGDVQFFL